MTATFADISTHDLGNAFSVYTAIAFVFNLTSLTLLMTRGRTLVPHEPLQGITYMSIIYLVYALGPALNVALYVFLLTAFATLVFLNGLLPHLQGGYSPDKYYGWLAWLLPMLLNVYGIGVIALTIAHWISLGF